MIGVIAANTFREAIRDRIWIVLILFGASLLISSQIFTPIALGEGPRVVVDLGLSALNLLGVLVAVLVGANMVHQEIDRRSIHIILARPVGRTTYLLGKWLGLTAMLWSTGLVMGILLTAVAWQVRGSEIVLPVAQAVVLACLSFTILSSLAILFSSLSTPLLSALYSIGIYLMGWWAMDLRAMARTLAEPSQGLLTAASYVLPNLDIFNARFAVAHMEAVPWLQVALAAVYAVCYSMGALALAAIAFNAREFK